MTMNRLGRLNVQNRENQVIVRTANVKTFSISKGHTNSLSANVMLLVDEQEVHLNELPGESPVLLARQEGQWKVGPHFFQNYVFSLYLAYRSRLKISQY